jgi:hypothetical protein
MKGIQGAAEGREMERGTKGRAIRDGARVQISWVLVLEIFARSQNADTLLFSGIIVTTCSKTHTEA